MLIKLSLRNAMRIWKDYLIFFITIFLSTVLMYSFNGLLFSDEISILMEESDLKEATAILLGMATIFIIGVMIWLVQYMVGFIVEKRSREYANWMLLGMKRNQILRQLWMEGLVTGTAAFVLGIVFGIFFQQAVFYSCYAFMERKYQFHIAGNGGCFAATLASFLLSYIPALLFRHKKLRKMSIVDFMNLERKNEEICDKGSVKGRAAFVISLLYILFWEGIFYFYLDDINILSIMCLVIGLVVSVYFMFAGMSACLSHYLNKKGKLIYKGIGLFLLRQMASKIRTLRFTFTILTLLLVFSIMTLSTAPMLYKYQQTQIDYKYPFSMSFHGEIDTDLQAAIAAVKKSIPEAEAHSYGIYRNGTGKIREYLLKNLKLFRGRFTNSDGSLNQEEAIEQNYYYEYDTFMKLSDYNALRQLIGLSSVFENVPK